MSCEPVTIEIEPDCINIMNFPGIDRSISEKTIEEGKRFVSRYYRNRRLGEFFTDKDRRAMRIRIPAHPSFLNSKDELAGNVGRATNKFSKKKVEQHTMILNYMADGEWHKTSEVAAILGLKDTRTKELLKELVVLEKLDDNGKTKGKLYRLK